MNAEKLRQLTGEELVARIRDLRGEVFNLKIKHATGQLESSGRLRLTRRDLARALTVRTQRGDEK